MTRRAGGFGLGSLLMAAALSACQGSIGAPGPGDSNALPGAGGARNTGNGNGNGAPAAGSLPNGTPAQSGNNPGGSSATPGEASDCGEVKLGPRRLWRLTPTQYDNTLHDLFGIDSSYGAGFPADEVIDGFSNVSDALLITPLMADKIQAAASDVAAEVDLSRISSCAGSQRDDACLRDFVTKLGERAFRRPLAAADVDRYLALSKLPGDFERGARLVVSALLQSPHFLYRFEIGSAAAAGSFALNDYEVASELSYLLWQSMPDDALFDAARAGKLHDKTQVAQQLDRMLASPRARPVVRAFVFEWLGLDVIPTVPKDTQRFPELTQEIRSALVAEAERFIDHVMFEQDGSVSALLTSPTTFLDAKLASFYGASPPAGASGAAAIELPERRGILTLGGSLLSHSRSNDSSPVHRGKLVRERLLCQPLPPPPPGIAVQPPPFDETKTTRERYAAHSSVEPCATCHRLMDPIGLSFEHFDGIGRYRADDNGHSIDVSGEIVSSPHSDGKFVGTDELIDKLEASQDVHDCYALQWYRFVYGFSESTNRCLADRFQKAIAQGDGSLPALLNVLTQADSFLAREAPSDDGSAPPVTDPGAPSGGSDAGAPQPDAGSPDASAPDSGAPQPDAGTPDAGAPEVPPDLEVTLSIDNDFGSGYCRTYQLRNRGSAPLTWSIPLDVTGKMNNHWECKVTGDSGRVVFSGEEYNATLQPGGMAQFGYCSQR